MEILIWNFFFTVSSALALNFTDSDNSTNISDAENFTMYQLKETLQKYETEFNLAYNSFTTDKIAVSQHFVRNVDRVAKNLCQRLQNFSKTEEAISTHYAKVKAVCILPGEGNSKEYIPIETMGLENVNGLPTSFKVSSISIDIIKNSAQLSQILNHRWN